ncbi:xylulokinase [Agrococcus jejuensis]|uniref:FGGY family of carbohydrate kinases, N-terminal domain n=1 Tax=Agrococcus jejuensis TaxID=399736 RepID=A0A1G8H066_9MICO|nr:FGGY-family carbohydrate kinase [Agrococcus jejuensis]SDI00058.1 FGGY family of carbohydrate kinases, N-terminal domain [Agrococcus jejuensis]
MIALDRAVVAVDVGTSAVRAALVSVDDGILRAVRVARTEGVGGATYVADALQRDVEGAVAALEVDGRPAALAIAAHIGAVAVDDALQPVVAPGSWSDARGLELLADMTEPILRHVLAASGRPAPAGGGLALAASLVGTDAARRVASVLSPKDLLVARLTGHVGADVVDAAYTLAFDVAAARWSDAADALGVPRGWLPPLATPDALVATLDEHAAARCRLAPGTSVVSGAPDGSAGIGILLGTRTDAIADVAGTTDVLGRLLVDLADAPRGSVRNPALVPSRWIAGGATGMTGGAVARWRALVGAVDEHAIADVPVGARGLQVVPGMSGTRFPRWRADDLGALVGQTPAHGAAEILRAAQEGASHVVREGVDVLDPSGSLPVVLAGGSTRSEHVVRMRAAILGRSVLVSSDPDVTLAGAAGLALVGAGLVDDLDEARDRLGIALRHVDPDARDVTAYAEQHEAWRATCDALVG